MEDKQELVAMPTTIDELTEWLETHEIDDPDYDHNFAKLRRLEEDGEQ